MSTSHNRKTMRSNNLEPTISSDVPTMYSNSRNSSAVSIERIQRKTVNVSNGGLRVLSPDVLLDRSTDLALEVYDPMDEQMSSGDSDDFDNRTARTSHVFSHAVPEPLSNRSKAVQDVTNSAVMESENYGALVPFEDEYEDLPDLPSDEETAIMREIRAEITAQVKTEMKSELAVYHNARKKLESPSAAKIPDAAGDDSTTLEPHVQEAMDKMRKLDRILAKKVRREKEVKRDRIMLQQKLKSELENLKPEGREETKEIKTNTSKFLALTLPASHNAGVVLEDKSDLTSAPVTPVFATQVLDDQRSQIHSKSTSSIHGKNTVQSNLRGGASTSNISQTSTRTTTNSAASDGRATSGKDFIKRNIELACDAGETIAMTDDEKQRLEDLLLDIDEMPDITSEPETLMLLPGSGEGFVPESYEKQRLSDIDDRLKQILPAEDYESICSSPQQPTPRSTLFTNTAILSTIDVDGFGEQVLRDTKRQREQHNRLNQIEQELRHLSTAVTNEIESPCLPNEQLHDLLEQCSRTMIRATEETDSMAELTQRSSDTSLSMLLDNPPHLPNDVLQQLLADAQSSNQLLHTENSNMSEHDMLLESITEEDMISARISARTASRLSQRANSFDTPQTRTLTSKRFLPQIDPSGSMSTQKFNNDLIDCDSRLSEVVRSPVLRRSSTSDTLTPSSGYTSPHPPPDRKP